MAQRNDDELAFYLTQAIKASGQISDEDSAYLLAQLSPYTGAAQINDLWRSFWVADGIPNGDYAGMAYAWLITQGIPPGQINDMWSAYFMVCLLIKSGQILSHVTSDWGVVPDDGALQKGTAKSYNSLNTGNYAGTVNIVLNGKTDVHTNNCVLDRNTGLIWSRDTAASVGPSSNGDLLWQDTVNAESIGGYAVAANLAQMAGFTDWRPPNIIELASIATYDVSRAAPDATYWPGFPETDVWSSTSVVSTSVSNAYTLNYFNGVFSNTGKTLERACILVRG